MIKVNFNPEKSKSGLVSQISWQNSSVQEALRKIFKLRDNEEITEIDVTCDGITAYFNYTPTTLKK